MLRTIDDARFWNGIARKYAGHRIKDLPGYERTVEHTRRLLRSSDAVLEIGCGTGTTALKLAPFVGRIVGSDLSNEMIAIARREPSRRAAAMPSSRLQRPSKYRVRTAHMTPYSHLTYCI